MKEKEKDETPTPVEVPGPRRVSVNLPNWKKSCLELAERLRSIKTPIRIARAAELEALAQQFEGFMTTPPSDEVRIKALTKYMDLQSSALDLLVGYKQIEKKK